MVSFDFGADFSSLSLYVIIGAGVIALCTLCWAAEWIIYCITCKCCRTWYSRITRVLYYMCCCCLCWKQEVKTNALDYYEKK